MSKPTERALDGLDLDRPGAEARLDALGRLEELATARVTRLRQLAATLSGGLEWLLEEATYTEC